MTEVNSPATAPLSASGVRVSGEYRCSPVLSVVVEGVAVAETRRGGNRKGLQRLRPRKIRERQEKTGKTEVD